jgi:ABC-type lipoprotein export system ATPase subunit
MARRNLFSDLEIQAFRAGITPRTKESIAWFRRKAGALGKITGETVFQSLQRIVHGTDTAALIVTHNQKLAAKMDEILELENGNIKRKQLL